LDACLPKLVDLALNAQERDTRIAACEFLHSLMIYMIGKNATQPKVGRGGAAQDGSKEIAPFAKIYQKLFPVIIRLASETE
jgi:DNA-dependent protein kinase catalytic subunit